MTYQKTVGTLSPGGHPGSYNGQDAYNDMLVIDDGNHDGIWSTERRNNVGGCGTLNASHEQPILFDDTEGSDDMSSVVRRLTPLECERLQGYPDGWTDIGEWTDSKGKKHKAADAPRYRALGNSIALPYWFYLLRRISAQYERPATLGSLFAGIGGFELCWLRCNGPGIALWSSEIDEYANAVLKKHFGDDETGEAGDIWDFLSR